MDPTISFASAVDPAQLRDLTRAVITDAARASGNPCILLTSLERSPSHQAQAMHDNCVKHGVVAQRRLYLAAGNFVIDVFVADADKTEADTVADMTAKIIEIGPEHVSLHCADPDKLGVADCANSKLTNRTAFVAALRADPRILQPTPEQRSMGQTPGCLDEPFNNCVHVVVPQIGA